MTRPALAPRPRTARSILASITVAAMAAFSIVAALPAHADTLNVTNESQLRAALGQSSPGRVELGASFEVTGSHLLVAGDARLDLGGHTLRTKNIILGAGKTLEIVDSSIDGGGELIVRAGPGEGAGIRTAGGTLMVHRGTVDVIAESGAGIGGNNGADGGAVGGAGEQGGIVYIFGGEVRVRGGAAGIGGGSGGSGADRGGAGGAGGYTMIHGGVVNVTGAFGAGIGGGAGATGIDMAGGAGGHGTYTEIRGGHVDATGLFGAGIGGGMGAWTPVFIPGVFEGASGGDGGTLALSAGTLVAHGNGGAGIGGGRGGDALTTSGGRGGNGGTVTITGGTLTAAGERAAAIGGGDGGIRLPEAEDVSPNHGIGGTAADLTVGAGSSVRVERSGTLRDAIGPGGSGREDHPTSHPPTGDSAFTLDGVLTLPSDQSLTVSADSVLSGSGSIVGDGGGGHITNYGIITPIVDLDEVSVSVNNFPVTFDANHLLAAPATEVVHVLAPTFDAGHRAFPVFSLAGSTTSGWFTASDGTGSELTPTTTLSGPLTVYAQWAEITHSMSASAVTPFVGEPVTLTVLADGGSPAGDQSSDFTFTTNGGEADIVGNVVTFTRPGAWTVMATHNVTGEVLTADLSASLNLADPATISLSMSETSVSVDDTIIMTVTGVDAYGNDLGDLLAHATIASDNGADIIDQDELTFLYAGSRTITAEVGGAIDTANVTVWPHESDYDLTANLATPLVGDHVEFTVTSDAYAFPGEDVTNEFTFTTSAPDALVTGNVVTFIRPGTWPVTATHSVTGAQLSTLITAALDFAHPHTVRLALSDTTGFVGDTVIASVRGADAYGNDLGDLTAHATIASTITDDVIAGDELSFPQAGTRTVSAQVGTATDTAEVTVWPRVADYDLTADPATPIVGDGVEFTVTSDAYGLPGEDVSNEFMFSTSARDAAVTGTVVTFIRPGTWPVTATHTVTGETVTIDVVVALDPTSLDAPAAITLTLANSTVPEGGTLTFTVTGVDGFGNDLDDLTDRTTITSSHVTDVIGAGSIRFPTASEHTITAVLGDATHSVTVTVVPAAAPADLPSTGTEAVPVTLAGILMLAIGGLAILARRRHA